jgi:Fe-S-cluster-containing hydrogenase component 2
VSATNGVVGRGLVSHHISVDESLCVGCAYCKLSCPTNAIEVEDALAHVTDDACTGCALCVAMCPVEAITTMSAEEA